MKTGTNLTNRRAGSLADRAAGQPARRGMALGALVALAGSACPVGVLAGASVVMVAGQFARAQCGAEVLTQSTAPDVIQAGRAVWCGNLETNADTQIARGFVAPHDMTISCVTFGVTRNTGGEWPCHVRIATGAPTDLYASRTVLAEETVQIPAGTFEEFFTVEIPPVFVPEGTVFTVELDTPSRFPASGGDGALLSLGFNALGQSAPSYLRAPACGAELRFIDLVALGFPNSHAAMSLGTESGYAVPTLGGFEITPIGDVVVSTEEGEVVAYGDGGLSIQLGDATMGAGANFRVLSTGDEVSPAVQVGFHGATTTDVLAFRNNPATSDEAVLDVLSDNPAFDRFRVRVFRNGELVGTLEDQASGTVRFADAGDGPIWDWIKGLFGGGGFEAHCNITKEYYESGAIKSTTQSYGASLGSALISPSGGGPGYVGDEITIEPMMATLAGEPPLSLSIVGDGVVGVAIDVDDLPPAVVIGQAETSVRSVGAETTTQVGVSMKAINTKGVNSGSMYATDLTGDGEADLRYVPGLAGEGESVRMELGGVESATISMDLTVADPFAACMVVCSFEVGPISIPTGKTVFDPWPIDPMFVAVAPDFTGVGDETYTFQVFDAAGTLVHEASGMRGIAGGTSRWPWKVGKLGGQTPCFAICYPDGTLLRLADGQEFDVHEVRALAEGAPPAGPLSALDIGVLGMDQVVLSNPVTVLPEIAEPCYADLDGDGVLTLFDFLAYQNLFATGSPVADCDEDGALTLFDFLCFQNAFAVGCP